MTIPFFNTYVYSSIRQYKLHTCKRRKQKTAYEISACLVSSEMCIRDRRGQQRRPYDNTNE